MTSAVEIPWMNTICFVFDRPEERPGMTVLEGAWIDIAPNFGDWPHGSKRPEQVLCQDIDDSNHYKLFRYHDDYDPSQYRETGMHFGGTFSKAAWEDYVERLAFLESVRAITDDEGV